MKNITPRASILTRSAFLLSAFQISVFAQFASPINASLVTTSSYSIAYSATVPGFFTNAPMSVVNPSYEIIGDTPPVEAAKINAGFSNVWTWSIAQSNLTAAIGSNLNSASNALAEFLTTNTPGSGGGGGNVLTNGGRMAFDFNGGSNNIVSDGLGDQTNTGSASFMNGQVLIENLGIGMPAPVPVVYANGFFVPGGGGFFDNGGTANFALPAAGSTMQFTPDGSIYVNSGSGAANGIDFSSLNLMQFSALTSVYISWQAGNVDLNLDDSGICNIEANGTTFDFEQASTDGSGDFYAPSFNVTSDRALKEQIQPLAPGNALAMILTLTNYSWHFRAHTNTVSRVTRSGSGSAAISTTNPAPVAVTNRVAKTFPAGGTEFGPMAQDWHAATGLQDGRRISLTSEAGLLLGAVQALAALQGTCTNAAGARFRLLVNAQTNGFSFLPQ